MPAAPLPSNENVRLDALRRFRILDTVCEESFDDFAQLASDACGTPIALVSLVDECRQWFKAKVGMDEPETSREVAFCSYAILDPTELLVVPDATKDDRFSDNPLVTGKFHLRFYAGAPLLDPEGLPLGTLCVMDREPRQLLPTQMGLLTLLARRVSHQLELRNVAIDLADVLEHVDQLEGMLPICSKCKSIRDDDGQWNRIEDYVSHRSLAEFTHGICPSCLKDIFPELTDESGNIDLKPGLSR